MCIRRQNDLHKPSQQSAAVCCPRDDPPLDKHFSMPLPTWIFLDWEMVLTHGSPKSRTRSRWAYSRKLQQSSDFNCKKNHPHLERSFTGLKKNLSLFCWAQQKSIDRDVLCLYHEVFGCQCQREKCIENPQMYRRDSLGEFNLRTLGLTILNHSQ